jgi:hypothetical protein
LKSGEKNLRYEISHHFGIITIFLGGIYDEKPMSKIVEKLEI